MGKLSRQKGKVGEREVAELLRRHGIAARRGVQFQGGKDSPDVVSDMRDIHFEVKRTEKLSIWDAYTQANEDARDDQTPVVVHRANSRPWIAVLSLEAFITLWLKANRPSDIFS